MSGGGAEREAGFGNLPKWPDEAKELPDARNREPRRSRLQWALGLGAVGAVVSLLLGRGGDPAILVGSMAGGFAILAIVGLLIERFLFDRERNRRRWEDR